MPRPVPLPRAAVAMLAAAHRRQQPAAYPSSSVTPLAVPLPARLKPKRVSGK